MNDNLFFVKCKTCKKEMYHFEEDGRLPIQSLVCPDCGERHDYKIFGEANDRRKCVTNSIKSCYQIYNNLYFKNKKHIYLSISLFLLTSFIALLLLPLGFAISVAIFLGFVSWHFGNGTVKLESCLPNSSEKIIPKFR